MKSTALLAAAILVGTALSSATGCALNTAPSEEPGGVKEGLTILEAKADVSISAAFRKGTNVVFMQALRGKATPEIYQKAPDQPKVEVDIRFTDQNGRIFYIRRGGDSWVNPTWADDLERESALPDSTVSNEVLFQMAGEAAELLDREAAVPPAIAVRLVPELGALRSVGKLAPTLFQTAKLSVRPSTPTRFEIAYGSDDKGGVESPNITNAAGYFQMQLYAGVLSTSLDLGCLWDTPYHSATRLTKWDPANNYLGIVDSCNHGRCPSESGMSLKGTLAKKYKGSWNLMTCTATGYNAFSNDGHNCHDDSRTQMANFAYGGTANKNPGTYFWCYGDDSSDISCGPFGGEQDGHPNADTSTNRGYHHPNGCKARGITGYNSYAACYCDQACLTYNDCCIDGPY